MAHIPNRIYRVPNAPQNANVPHDGLLSFSDFYGTVGVVDVTYEIIGGGGEGAGGYFGGGNGGAGTASSFSGDNITSGDASVTVAGGAGGTQPAPFSGSFRTSEAGEASYYGSGGAGGANSDSFRHTPGSPAPASSYGAGGGGGGAHPFSANNGGGGGSAGTRQTGTFQAVIGSEITITIGTGGNINGGGGNGASGYCKFIIDGVPYEFIASTTFIVPVP